MVYVLFILGLILLGFGGDTMVSGAVEVAKKLKVSTLLIGIVLIGFGTSTPELVASFIAIHQEVPSTGIAVGNIVGSNIANILLILGVSSIIHPIHIEKKSFLKRDVWFLIASTFVIFVTSYTGEIGRIAGIVMVASLIFYVIYSYKTEKDFKSEDMEIEEEISLVKTKPLYISLIIAIIGIAMTLGGAKLLVDSAITIARNFGIAESIIGLTIVAVGTSLPELASSITASIKKHNDIAFGNIVGSNIYNTFFILGMVALFTPILFPSDLKSDVYILIATTLLLITTGVIGKISKLSGVIFLVCYAFYITYLVG
ncbi:MAG: calcium/sodium antiporter [Alphaproteobacteria bacterium]|nr:calcium/sodium antiporter [Alphaproteobacteria bacterium]